MINKRGRSIMTILVICLISIGLFFLSGATVTKDEQYVRLGKEYYVDIGKEITPSAGFNILFQAPLDTTIEMKIRIRAQDGASVVGSLEILEDVAYTGGSGIDIREQIRSTNRNNSGQSSLTVFKMDASYTPGSETKIIPTYYDPPSLPFHPFSVSNDFCIELILKRGSYYLISSPSIMGLGYNRIDRYEWVEKEYSST
jgi:hypothetical protein